MKHLKKTIIVCLLIAAAIGCTKPVLANLTMVTSFLSVVASGDAQDISFKTNQSWSISSDAAWVTAHPTSGSASDSYQFVTVTVAPNTETAERTATLTVTAGEKSAQVSIKQSGKPVASRMTVQEFRNKKADETTWYELSGEIASILNDEYGNFYLVDETGMVYVYGLCKTQRPKGGNDQSFAELGLKPGDKVTMKTLRSEHNGTIEAGGQTPAYFVSKEEGTYRLGRKVASTTAQWMELPATSAGDKQDLLIHYFPDGKRSYAAYYDYEHFLSTWVAYPLHAGNIGTGSRTDAFALDPLVPRAQQQYNPTGYKEGNVKGLSRGHQIPSADRLDWRVNLETFYGTNMTPQDETLNGGAWDGLENRVRKWAKNKDTDTLYVVTGCSVAGSSQYVLDGDGKHIPVPVGYFKAVLRLAKDKSWSAAAFWLDNKPLSGIDVKNVAMSVDDLEKKVGVDFFVNLDADTQKTVESADPTQVAWWWNN
jgi:DNA/RNA endonuclease G (NUC1)